jgi:hypothetical protein
MIEMRQISAMMPEETCSYRTDKQALGVDEAGEAAGAAIKLVIILEMLLCLRGAN